MDNEIEKQNEYDWSEKVILNFINHINIIGCKILKKNISNIDDSKLLGLKQIIKIIIANVIIPTKYIIEKIILDQTSIEGINKYELLYNRRNEYLESFNEIISIITINFFKFIPPTSNEKDIVEQLKDKKCSHVINKLINDGDILEEDIIKFCRFLDCFVDLYS